MFKTQKYHTIFKLAFVHSLSNYKALIGLSIFLITCLIIFAHLWKIAASKMGAIDLSSDQLLWYIAFNEWLLLSLPDVQEDIEEDLRSGRFSYLLPRPISYLWSVFFEGLGALSARFIVLGIVTFIFTWIRVGETVFDGTTFFVAVVLSFFAGCVGILFKMIIGISAFWMQQVEPFHWIWEKLLFTLGGLMLPLAVYPSWLEQIAHFTPFPAILGDRSALAIHFSWQGVFSLAGVLLFWTLLGCYCLLALYRRGLKVVNMEGG
jgi:ABC-2 type transport system permease protein